MTLTDWLWRTLGLETAAAPVRLREAAGVTIDDDDEGWRPLSGDGRRDLTPVTQARMQRLAVHTWEASLLGRWLIEQPIAFLVGEGVRLECTDPEGQGWLDDHWNDPITDWPMKLEERMRELALFGEACWRVYRNEISGAIRLGTIDPTLIDTVVCDPDNLSQPIGVVVVAPSGKRRLYRIVMPRPDAELFGPGAQKLRAGMSDGEVIYHRINGLSTGRRGRSDLLAAIDWVDAYERLLYGELERADALRSVIWDVTLAGATEEQVKARAQTIDTPPPLSVRVHNESETWSALAPKLDGGDTGDAARLFRNQILGGCGFPEHWFGGGGDINRATASEMGEPVYKMLSRRQKLWQAILERLGALVLSSRLAAAGLDPETVLADPAWRVRAVFPELTAVDTSRYAAALQQVTAAVLTAVDRELLSEETALSLVAAVAGRLGVDIEPKDELARARDAAAARAEADTFTLPPDPAAAADATP